MGGGRGKTSSHADNLLLTKAAEELYILHHHHGNTTHIKLPHTILKVKTSSLVLATCNGGRLRNNFERLLAIPEDSWMMERVKCESGEEEHGMGRRRLASHSSLRLANILLTSANRRIPLKCSSSKKPL